MLFDSIFLKKIEHLRKLRIPYGFELMSEAVIFFRKKHRPYLRESIPGKITGVDFTSSIKGQSYEARTRQMTKKHYEQEHLNSYDLCSKSVKTIEV